MEVERILLDQTRTHMGLISQHMYLFEVIKMQLLLEVGLVWCLSVELI